MTEQKPRTPTYEAFSFMGLGIQMVSYVLGCGAIGWFTDKQMASSGNAIGSFWTVVGFSIGAVYGLYDTIRTVLKKEKLKKNNEQ